MTTETISTKLSYLLSWPGMTLRQLRHYMGKSLRGEVTEASAPLGDGLRAAIGGDLRL